MGMASSRSHLDFLFFLSAAALNASRHVTPTATRLPWKSECHLPVSSHGLLPAPHPIILITLWEKLGGGVGRDSGPQAKDALPLLYFLATQKPEQQKNIVFTAADSIPSSFALIESLKSFPCDSVCHMNTTGRQCVTQLSCVSYLLLYLLRASNRCCPLSTGGVFDS